MPRPPGHFNDCVCEVCVPPLVVCRCGHRGAWHLSKGCDSLVGPPVSTTVMGCQCLRFEEVPDA